MFTPVVAVGGLPGWALLSRTIGRQTALFNAAPALRRDTDHFRQSIAGIESAADLVSDRRLLRVALGAFGLQDDIDSRAFVRAIIEQGTGEREALANRLADDRYRAFAEAFGHLSGDGGGPPPPGFGARIVEQFRRREFEVAVGEQDGALRLALNADRELAALAAEGGSDNALWFRILGTPPLRETFETALGLPQSFAGLDLDRQLAEMRSAAARQLGIGSPRDLADDGLREGLVRQFLLRDQIAGVAVSSAQSIALTLLQSAPRLF
ncbi:DUF1217 domain-containing protein [Roseovarius ramblicola]|uniref:DUF1217 domain-containing protein n=1 Tax=Roseovarius ramblicola TaxID=2022336 RepID=A0ABV5HW87_9RHOB